MKKMNLVAIMLVVLALFTAGCLGGDDDPEPPVPMNIVKTTDTTSGFSGNADWSGAEPSSVNYLHEAENDTIIVAYILTLTWSDDYDNEADEFELKANAGNSTMKASADTGTIELIVGASNFGEGDDENATISDDTLKTDYTPLGSADITVTCLHAGTYPGGFIGFRNYWDPGNDWNLNIETWVLEPTGPVIA